MKLQKITSLLLLTMVLQTVVCGQQAHKLDTKLSKIKWNTGKMGQHTGYLLFQSGTLYYSTAGEPTNGSFMIDMKSVTSTDKATEKDRKTTEATIATQQFFDIVHYPVSVMQVLKMERIGKTDTYHVTGDLTIKGITKSIGFVAALTAKNGKTHVTGNVDVRRLWWRIDVSPEQTTEMVLDLVKKVPDDNLYVTLDLVFD